MAKSGTTGPTNGNPENLPVSMEAGDRALLDPNQFEYVAYTQTQPEAKEDVQIHQLLGILRRHVGLILGMGLVGALLAGIAVLFVPPQYTARAQVVVEPQQPAAGAVPAPGATSVDVLTIDTQITMLAARDHLRAVLASLANDPSLVSGETRSVDETGTALPGRQPVQEFVSRAWTRARQIVGTGTEIPSFEIFEKTLRIDQERKSRVISVRYTSTSPELAAAAVNRVIELYSESQSAKAAAAGRTELAKLEARIGDLEQTMTATEKKIRAELTNSQDLDPSVGVPGARLRQLEREVIENAQSYERLAQRQTQLRAEIDTRAPSFKVLYLATHPNEPSSLDTKYFVLPAIILAMLGGGVMAVMRESFDRTLRSVQQVQRSLGIPCVALVPRLGWFQGRRPHEHLLKKPYSPYSEAVRSIGASLQFGAADGKRPQIVQITSSVRNEGKTTLATSLAVYATRMHPRVLLVDLDFRQPSVAATFNISADSGVLDLMIADATFAEVVHHVPSLGLDVLPMTVCPIDPVTLFSNGELEKLLDRIRKEYDFIIVDSPPLLGITEAALLANLSDVVVFATKWGSTRLEVTQNALTEFRSIGWTKQVVASRVRAVVTQVELKRHARYQYGDFAETLVRHRSSYEPTHRAGSIANQRKKVGAGDDEGFSGRMAAE